MSYESVVKEDSPKGYWRLGESSGTEAKDASGNAQNGTYKNAPTLAVAGAIGLDSNTAVSFASASKQWVSVPDSATLDLGDVLTYEAWVKRASTGTGQTILDKGGGSLIVRFLANNKILVRRNGVANICESTVAITDTTSWHHVVVTKNGATVKIYIDGADVTGTVTNSTLVNTAIVLGIGAADAGTEEFFNGSIDEVAVYGTALSKARVEAHYAAGTAKTVEGKGAGSGAGTGAASGTRGRVGAGSGSGAGAGSAAGTRGRQGKASGEGVGSGSGSGVRTGQGKGAGAGAGTGAAGGTRGRLGKAAGSGTGSGSAEGETSGGHLSYKDTVLGDTPYGYWRLDESEGATTAADSSTKGNDGVYKNSVELELTGGLVTDANTSASFNTGGTVEKDHVLVPDSATLDLGDVFTLEAWIRRDGIGLTDCIIDKGEGAFIFRFDGEDHLLLRRNSVADIARSTVKITDAKWHHVVATKSGASVHIYVDGVDVTGAVTNQTCANTAVALTIGASNAGEEDYFRGGLDEVAVYRVVLTAGEVLAHFEAGFVPIPPESLTAPSISGALELGQRLTADEGTWEYNPASYAYQWQVSDKEGTGFVGIVGASTSAYVVQRNDVGRYLRCVVTATNASGSTDAASAPGHVAGTATAARLWVGELIEDYFRQSAPGAITEVPDPGGSGREVFRFDVHKADVEPVTPTKDPRAQLAGPVLEIGEGFVRYPFVDGSEVWIEFAFRLPSAGLPAEQPSWFQIIQLFGPPFEGVAPWAIKAANDFTELIWQRNATYGFDIPWEAPTSRDHWTRGLLHLRLAEDGWVEMWIDGDPVTFFAPGSSYNPNGEPETTRLEMATLDESNDGPYGSTIFLQNYWEAGSFEEAVIYHEPPSVWLGLGGAGPVAITGTATPSGASAVLHGVVDSKGLPATARFEYWKEGEEGSPSLTPIRPVTEGVGLTAFSARVDGLERGATYYFRILATTGGGEAVGALESFVAQFRAIAVTRDYPPDRLAWLITPSSGRPFRWAADEPDVENVIAETRLVDEMPGGEKEASGTLARNPRITYSDLAPYSSVEIINACGEAVWEGRLDRAPESDGEHMAIAPEAVGWQAALDDNKAIIGPGFIDSDLSKWGDPSTQRKIELLKEAAVFDIDFSAGFQDKGEGAPGINFTTSEIKEAMLNVAEAWYDGGGVDLRGVLYDFFASGTADAAFEEKAHLSSDDLLSYFEAGTDHNQTSASGQSFTTATAGLKYAFLRVAYLAAAGFSVDYASIHAFLNLKVLGSHPLSLQGTWPNVGYTVSQMLAYAIPLYTELTADPEDLEDSGYVIQQAWFSDPGPMSAVVAELTKYELLDWFCRGKRFNLRFPGTYGREWLAYAGPSGLQEQGLDGSRLWREILVTYQDVDGSTRTVGPPGSGANVEDAGLEITDPDHPAVRAEITRRDRLDLRGISTPARAIEAGEYWLREANLLSRSGSATLSGYAMDSAGVMRPVSMLRAGDRVRFPDAADTSPRKVVRRAYEDVTKTVSVDLDAPPEGLEALLERLQADIKSLALG